MAEKFDILTSYQDVEFLGGSNTRDVHVAGAVTKPDGIYFEVRVPSSVYKQEGPSVINAAALGTATILETLLTVPHVAGVLWGQQAVGGQLQDVAIITVVSKSGNSSEPYTVPFVKLGPKLNATQIAAISKRLDETEAL